MLGAVGLVRANIHADLEVQEAQKIVLEAIILNIIISRMADGNECAPQVIILKNLVFIIYELNQNASPPRTGSCRMHSHKLFHRT
jgi:hypothetical protein